MEYDVAIAGAGPAGSTLALLLARAGLRVLVAESSGFGKPRVGETAPPELRSLLARAGLAHVLDEKTHREAPSVVSIWGSDAALERTHILSPFGRGVHLDRCAFDRAIARAAQDAGAEVRLGTRVRFRRRGPGIFDAISATGLLACAKHVVLASGRRGGERDLSGSRCYLDDQIGIAARIGKPVERRTVIEAISGGWFYLAMLPDEEAVAVFMTRASAVSSGRRARHHLWLDAVSRTKFVRSAMPALPDADALSVHDARASYLTRAAGRDWCAIGDARLAPDPLSGQGIMGAVEDALHVADLIAVGWSARDGEAMQARHLADVDAYRSIRDRTYATEGRFPDDLYWTSRRSAARKPLSA